eukprot:211185-Pelagomonas_calceolata.AAC.2
MAPGVFEAEVRRSLSFCQQLLVSSTVTFLVEKAALVGKKIGARREENYRKLLDSTVPDVEGISFTLFTVHMHKQNGDAQAKEECTSRFNCKQRDDGQEKEACLLHGMLPMSNAGLLSPAESVSAGMDSGSTLASAFQHCTRLIHGPSILPKHSSSHVDLLIALDSCFSCVSGHPFCPDGPKRVKMCWERLQECITTAHELTAPLDEVFFARRVAQLLCITLRY